MTNQGIEIDITNDDGSTTVIDVSADGHLTVFGHSTGLSDIDIDTRPVPEPAALFGSDSGDDFELGLELATAVALGGLGGWAIARALHGGDYIDEDVAEAELDRSALRDAIDDLIDLLPSPALQDRLTDALAEAGIQRDVPAVGAGFDPNAHEAVGADDTDDSDLAMTISSVERPGLVDRNKRVTLTKVRVHVLDEAPVEDATAEYARHETVPHETVPLGDASE